MLIPNSRSSCSRSSTKASESSTPVSNRSVSIAGTSTWTLSRMILPIRSCTSDSPVTSQLLVLGGQDVEQDPVVGSPIDVVALPLPSDEAEIRGRADGHRWVMLDSPAIDGDQSEFVESHREHLGHRPGGVTLASIGLLAQHRPDRGRLEAAINIVQTDDADRCLVIIGRKDAEHVRLPLTHDLDQQR